MIVHVHADRSFSQARVVLYLDMGTPAGPAPGMIRSAVLSGPWVAWSESTHPKAYVVGSGLRQVPYT